MDRALGVARRAWGETHPNPMVGALVVEGGEVVAEGFHARAGGPHAEVAALGALGRRPRPGATLVVTLEPCSTHGRTGPCTEAIAAAGIARVVAGATDPNPAHRGGGYARLRELGVEVVEGVRAAACERLNLVFNHWIATRRPLVAVKVATTLDGCVATRAGESRWITGPEARADAAEWRRLFPAILVGAGTVVADDPRLTARRAGREEWCPRRIVLDGRARLAGRAARVLDDAHRDETTIVVAADTDPALVALLKARVDVWELPAEQGRVRWAAVAERLAEEGVTGVLVEGGPDVVAGLLAEGAVDHVFAYQAPLLLADAEASRAWRGRVAPSLADALEVADPERVVLGADLLIHGSLRVRPGAGPAGRGLAGSGVISP